MIEPTLELWKATWRRGFAPLLSLAELTALEEGLASDDPRICQGTTVIPGTLPDPAAMRVACAACAIGYMALRTLEPARIPGFGDRRAITARQVEDYFDRHCFDADRVMGEAAACRYFLNWFDETPRAEAFRLLLDEVRLAITDRIIAASATTNINAKDSADPSQGGYAECLHQPQHSHADN